MTFAGAGVRSRRDEHSSRASSTGCGPINRSVDGAWSHHGDACAPGDLLAAAPLRPPRFRLQVYQAVCFRLLSLRRVRRRDYAVIDRLVLPYLNPIQKANCAYCGYVNGLIAFAREIAGRTEQDLVPHQTQGAITRAASASASFRAVRRRRRVCPTPAAVAPGAHRATVTPRILFPLQLSVTRWCRTDVPVATRGVRSLPPSPMPVVHRRAPIPTAPPVWLHARADRQSMAAWLR